MRYTYIDCSFIFLALIKVILFPWTITTASIDISSNMQGFRKVILMPAAFHLEVF